MMRGPAPANRRLNEPLELRVVVGLPPARAGWGQRVAIGIATERSAATRLITFSVLLSKYWFPAQIARCCQSQLPTRSERNGSAPDQKRLMLRVGVFCLCALPTRSDPLRIVLLRACLYTDVAPARTVRYNPGPLSGRIRPSGSWPPRPQQQQQQPDPAKPAGALLWLDLASAAAAAAAG